MRVGSGRAVRLGKIVASLGFGLVLSVDVLEWRTELVEMPLVSSVRTIGRQLDVWPLRQHDLVFGFGETSFGGRRPANSKGGISGTPGCGCGIMLATNPFRALRSWEMWIFLNVCKQ